MTLWNEKFKEMPLVAILRGLSPEEAIDVSTVLVEAGIKILEVPLNSPNPLESISKMKAHFMDQAIIGAGTVLTGEAAKQVHDNGGELIVAPNLNADVAANDVSVVPAAPAEPEVLPAVSPEEQYRFALGRALQNDLETAELAFAEFRVFNKDHERQADATFWLGRVQFMRGEYEKAAMTFSEFNSTYPGDARLVDTTMWIAESVSHFAPAEQACEIYASLPKLLDTPPETFMTQIAALSNAAKCKS